MTATITNAPALVESKLRPNDAIYRWTIPAGEPWIHEIQKGQYFRIVDLHGNQAVESLFDARPVLLHSYAADRGAVRGKKTASRRTFPLCSTTRPLRAGK